MDKQKNQTAAGILKAQAQSNTTGPGLQADNQSFLVTEGVQPWELSKTSQWYQREHGTSIQIRAKHTLYRVIWTCRPAEEEQSAEHVAKHTKLTTRWKRKTPLTSALSFPCKWLRILVKSHTPQPMEWSCLRCEVNLKAQRGNSRLLTREQGRL